MSDFHLPSNLQEWTAMVMAWNYGPGIDFYDVLCPNCDWLTALDYERHDAAHNLRSWFHINQKWLIGAGLVKPIGGTCDFEVPVYIRSTGILCI